MPKKHKPNAFMCFVHEIMRTSRKGMNMYEAREHAAPIWKNMSLEDRAVYHEQANKESSKFQNSSDTKEKLDSYGIKIAESEKARISRETKERDMKRDIESIVRSSRQRGDFEKQKHYFIMVNYFTHTNPGDVYVPAELSVSEFSLADGVTRKYHIFVNPGVAMYGHMHQAKEHANQTHKLPLPPNAMGEKNLTRIYDDIVAFVGKDDKDEEKNNPVYTHCDAIPIVESVLRFLTVDHPDPDADKKLSVYSIQHLLFIMKEAACEIGELPKIQVHHITDAHFEKDLYEYHAGLSCNYHEDLDKSKYCTQSIVTRWGFMFCKYMCSDVAISLIPGRHIPKEVQVMYAVTPGGGPLHKREYDDDSDRPGCSKRKREW